MTLTCCDCLAPFEGEPHYFFAPGQGRCPGCEEAREAHGREQTATVRRRLANAPPPPGVLPPTPTPTPCTGADPDDLFGGVGSD